MPDRPTIAGFYAPAWAVGSIPAVLICAAILFLSGAW